MKTLFAIAILIPLGRPAYPDGDGAATNPDNVRRSFLMLEDGSTLPAEPGIGEISLSTPFGNQRIPLRDIEVMRRLGGLEFLVRTASLTVTGDLKEQPIDLLTPLGPLKIPPGDLKAVTSGMGIGGLIDSGTVALWSFSESLSNPSKDFVNQHSLEFHEMEVTKGDEGRTVAVSKSDIAYADSPAVPDLDFVGSDFTLEARFKTPSTFQKHMMLIWKTDGSFVNYGAEVLSNGCLFVVSTSNQGNWSIGTPQSVLKPNVWCYVAIVVDAANGVTTFYVNGHAVHTVQGQFQVASNPASPLVIGVPPALASNFTPPQAVDFVRLSRVARSAEEIQRCQMLLDSRPNLPGGCSEPGIHLRGGGCVRTSVTGLSGATFRTVWGALKLPEDFGGSLRIFRFRPDDIPGAEKKVDAELRRLGAPNVADREAAAARLVELGEIAVSRLKGAGREGDTEVGNRARGILKTLEAAGVAQRPPTDVLTCGDTVLYGWLEMEKLEVKTPYGRIAVPLDRLAAITTGPAPRAAPRNGQRTFRLKSGERLQAELPNGITLALETAFGILKIPVCDVQKLVQELPQAVWKVKTERMEASGKLAALSLAFDTPAGRVSFPLSEVAEMTPSAAAGHGP